MKKFLLSILLLPAAWLAGAEVALAENIFVPKKVADIAVADVTDGSKEVVIRNRITPTIFLKTSADAVHETKLPLAPNDKFRIVTTGEAGVYYIYSVAQSGYVVLKEGVSPSANGTDKSVLIQKGNPTNAAKWVIEYEKGANDPEVHGRVDIVPYSAKVYTNAARVSFNCHGAFREGDILGVYNRADPASTWQIGQMQEVELPFANDGMITLKNRQRDKYVSAKMGLNQGGAADAVQHSEVWQAKSVGSGRYRLYNPYLNRYLRLQRPDWGAAALTAKESEAAAIGIDLEVQEGGKNYFSLKYLETSNTAPHMDNLLRMVAWYTDGNAGSQFVVEAAPAWDATWAAGLRADLNTLIAKAKSVPNWGTGLGQFNYADGLLEEADNLVATSSTDHAAMTQKIKNIDNATLALNMPKEAQFLRIKSHDGAKRLSNLKEKDAKHKNITKYKLVDNDGENTIFYRTGDKLVALQDGRHFGKNSDNFPSSAAYGSAGTVITFKASATSGKYCIDFGARSLHLDPSAAYANAASPNQDGGFYVCTLEEVTSLPLTAAVTIGGKAFGSFYAPVAGHLTGNDVVAYTAKVNGSKLMLTPIPSNEIPAGAAFLFTGTNVQFVIADNAAAPLVGNDLRGYAVSTHQGQANDWALSKSKKAFAKMGSYYKRAFRAVLENVTLPAHAQGLTLGLEEVTAIEDVVIEGAQDAPLYDLSGRRVEKTTKGGIYVQGGKKMVF